MIKYICIFILNAFLCYSQSYKPFINQILENNMEIKIYSEYLNGVSLDTKINNFLPDPQISYSYMANNDISNLNKQEFSISQSFEFPYSYIIKSDIASFQDSVNKYKFYEFKKAILLKSFEKLSEYIFNQKYIAQLIEVALNYENIVKAMQTKFDKAEIGLTDLNKVKVNYATAKYKLDNARITLNNIVYDINKLNGGINSNLELFNYDELPLKDNWDTLIQSLVEADHNIQAFNNQIELEDKKLALAKISYLPTLSVAYHYEKDLDLDFSGIQLGMSIPLFENKSKVPKAENELSLIKLQKQNYLNEYIFRKKKLFEKATLLKKIIEAQKQYIDTNQSNINKKSLDSAYISLTQYFYDNTLYYDAQNSILESELEYYKTLYELNIEIIMNEY